MSNQIVAKHKTKRYTQEEVDAALACMVKCRHNSRQAAAELAELGLDVPHRTLYEWANRTHKEDMQRIEAEYGPRLRETAIHGYEAATRQSLQLADKIAQRMGKEIEEIPARDLPAAQRNVMTSAAVATDKALLLKGEPTEIKAKADMKDLLKALKQEGVGVIEAEVVSEEDVPPKAA